MDEVQKKSRTRRTASAKSKTQVEDVMPSVPVQKTSSTPKRKAKVALPLDMMVCCVSSVAQGELVYISKRMQGMSFEWGSIGDEQYVELAELQAMRNSYPSFFEQNWILIEDEDVLEFLHASHFYKHVHSVNDLYDLLNKTPQDIRAIVPELSASLKASLAYVAKQQYQNGSLDSSARIKAIEMTTGFTIQS